MKHLIPLSSVVTIVVAAGVASAQPGASESLSGRWVHQGAQQELVLQPVIKLQPYVVPGYGTSMGGSVGYGSATSTNIVTEARQTRVERQMTLTMSGEGTFEWRATRRQPEGENCTRTVTELKRGTVQAVGTRLVFHVQGGNEEVGSSCGARSEAAITPREEVYQMDRTNGRLRLTSGGVSWTFNRTGAR